MNVKIKLFATLREGRGKVIDLVCPDATDVRAILAQLDIALEDVAILLVNGLDGHLDQRVNENDTLSVFPPVGGG